MGTQNSRRKRVDDPSWVSPGPTCVSPHDYVWMTHKLLSILTARLPVSNGLPQLRRYRNVLPGCQLRPALRNPSST